MQLGVDHLQILREYQPRERDELSLMKAAVSMILRDGERGAEVLLMQRAFHPKDPWSGQMCFPGGKIDPSDLTSRDAAQREAFEEVGVQLQEQDYIGRLDDLYGLKVNKVFSVHIACYVFKPERDLQLTANDEVADMVWLPLSFLNDPRNAHDFVHPSAPEMAMPAVMIDQEKSQILWGLTLRMLSNFHNVLGQNMAVLSEAERQELREIELREASPSVVKRIENELAEREA